jgi:hypothetical protein
MLKNYFYKTYALNFLKILVDNLKYEIKNKYLLRLSCLATLAGNNIKSCATNFMLHCFSIKK